MDGCIPTSREMAEVVAQVLRHIVLQFDSQQTMQKKSSLHLQGPQAHIWSSIYLLENYIYSSAHNSQESLREATDSLNISPLRSFLCPSFPIDLIHLQATSWSPTVLNFYIRGCSSSVAGFWPTHTHWLGNYPTSLSQMIPLSLLSWRLPGCPHSGEHNCSWVYPALPVGLRSRQLK